MSKQTRVRKLYDNTGMASLKLRLPEVVKRELKGKPTRFCEMLFRSRLTPDQKLLIDKAMDPNVRKIAWKSGHGVGKGFGAGNLMAAFSLINYDPKVSILVVLTAPTGRQAKGAPWEEMKRCIERMQMHQHTDDLGHALVFGLRSDELPGDQQWRIRGHLVATHFTADPNRPTGFQGFHAAKIIVVIDEAAGVDDRIIQAASTLATGMDATIVLLGNPTASGNEFERAFAPTSDWVQITSNCFQHPNVLAGKELTPGAVTREWIVDRWNNPVIGDGKPITFPAGPVKDWESWPDWPRVLAHKNAWWRGHVLGEFPTDSTNKLIALSWVERAFQTEINPPVVGARFMGVDVARFGADHTALCVMTSTDVLHMELHPMTSGPQAVKLVRSLARDWSVDPRNVNIDATGMGGMGVVDWLKEFAKVEFSGREEGFWKYCHGVEFASRAHEHDIFVDRKTELLWNLAKRLEHGRLGMKHLTNEMKEVLRHQLPKLQYEIRGGKFAIESKDQYKKRAGQSPDAAEALALACWPWGDPQDSDEGKTMEQIAEEMGVAIAGMKSDDATFQPKGTDRRISEAPLNKVKTEADEEDELELKALMEELEDEIEWTLEDD